jgi:hypothetical protein
VDDRNRRIFLFLGALIIALLMALIVLLVTSDDLESTAAATTTSTVATTTTGAAEATSTSETSTTTTEAATTSTSSSTPTTSPPTTATTPTTTLPPEPVEVSRGTATLEDSDVYNSGTTPPFYAQLTTFGFQTNNDWWMVSTAMPGAEGCRDSSGGAVANPVETLVLGLTVGWYGCSHMADGLVAQLHIIDVQLAPDRVIVEIVIWDFTP